MRIAVAFKAFRRVWPGEAFSGASSGILRALETRNWLLADKGGAIATNFPAPANYLRPDPASYPQRAPSNPGALEGLRRFFFKTV